MTTAALKNTEFQITSGRVTHKENKVHNSRGKKQENSPFTLQILRTCEKGTFWIFLQPQPFQ